MADSRSASIPRPFRRSEIPNLRQPTTQEAPHSGMNAQQGDKAMGRAVRGILGLVAVAFGVGVLATPAHAIQASGSIILSPSKQLQLAKGEIVQVAVAVVNTSSQTPLPPGPNAPATLTGPITVDLSCTDCGCSQKLSGSLIFVPGPASGCVTKDGNVTSCAQGATQDEVVINLAAAGIALPNNNTPVAIATISVKMNTDSGPPLGLRA